MPSDFTIEKNKIDLIKRCDDLLMNIEKDIYKLSNLYLKIKLDRDPTEEELHKFINTTGWKIG